MKRLLGDILANAHSELGQSTEEIQRRCTRLANKLSSFGLDVFGDNMRRVEYAAIELNRQVDALLGPAAMAANCGESDLVSLGRRLRHDIWNPLGVLRGYLELVQEDLVDSNARPLAKKFDELFTHIDSLEERVRTLLSFGNSVLGENINTTLPSSPPSEIANDEVAAIIGDLLVVDDNQSSRDYIAARLRKDGHHVSTAADGVEALEIMGRRSFDVLLLDLMMPGLSGYDVMERMRKSASLSQIAVIVISGLDQEQNAIKCIGLGAEDYLPKPVNTALLRTRVSSSLARKHWRDQERLYRLHLQAERSKSDALLQSTLPGSVVKRLVSGEKVIADAHEAVTVLFCDFVSFTKFAEQRPPKEVVDMLNKVFVEFDDICDDLGVEKIKTIGDGYLAVAGVPVARVNHAELCAEMALRMIEALDALNTRMKTDLEIRIGLHSGPVVAGVIGSQKIAYDVWGHTVNVAARHESYGQPQKIHISAETAALLGDKFELDERPKMQMRGIGKVTSYFLTGRKTARLVATCEDISAAPMPLSILLVDDDLDFLDITARRIRRQGWNVDCASNGREALERLNANGGYDLMITDCEMPGMNGFELTLEIRKQEEETGKRLSIVAVTGNDSVECAQRCLSVGMNAFLKKPVMWSEMERTIRQLRKNELNRSAHQKAV